VLNTPRTYFLPLDALRGIASAAILYFHTFWLYGLPTNAHGYLVVDFFFLLSGFVITHCYQQQMADRSLDLPRFFSIRLTRLYPLYLLGFAIAVAHYLLTTAFHRRSDTNLMALGFELFLLPSVYAARRTALFNDNNPAWSLFYELLANLFHILFFRDLSKVKLGISLAVSFVLYVYFCFLFGPDYGAKPGPGGFVLCGAFRVLFPYLAGVTLYRIWEKRKHAIPRLSFFLMALPLVLLNFVPAMQAHIADVFFAVFNVALLFPAIILLGANSTFPSAWKMPMKIMGELSYPIYILHFPFIGIFLQTLNNLLPAWLTPPWEGILVLLSFIPFAFLASRRYDIPLRQAIQRKLLAFRSTEALQSRVQVS
jgi:peptidoglycan/LPS O-acetylase OafA/YrhL